jgi:hypothetical protein
MQLGDPLWITHVNANFAAIESGLKSIGLIDVSALNEAEMLALDVPVGTKCWRPDTGTVWQLTVIPASNILNWVELPDLTLSVNEILDNRVVGSSQNTDYKTLRNKVM